MRNLVSPLKMHQTFCFACSPDAACFNACCRDLVQVLTPYDVLCLKQFLKLSSTTFLKAFTEESTGPQSGLPVVTLRFKDAEDLTCPFVSESGCRVYAARPASCRTYPLARGVSRNRETGVLTEQWALIREPHCLGFKNGPAQTVDQWVHDQQLGTHNRYNDMMLSLISFKNRFHPGPLMPSEKKLVHTALYDLDTFREMLSSKTNTPATVTDALSLGSTRTSDLDLLRVAMDWVRTTLLNPL